MEEPCGRGMQFKILLLEDDRRCLETLTAMVQPPAVPVPYRAPLLAREELRSMEAWPVGAIIDLVMPGENGLDFLAWCREAGFDGPVMLLTGGELRGDQHARCRELGARHRIKPVSSEELRDLLLLEAAITCVARDRLGAAATQIARERKLSLAEARVLAHLVAGDLLRDLPAVLGCSKNTIHTHCRHILAKTKRPSMQAVVAMVLRASPTAAPLRSAPDSQPGALTSGR